MLLEIPNSWSMVRPVLLLVVHIDKHLLQAHLAHIRNMKIKMTTKITNTLNYKMNYDKREGGTNGSCFYRQQDEATACCRAGSTAGHRVLPQPEDAGRGLCRWLLRHSTRSATREDQCSDKLRASSVALSRSEQRGSAARLLCHRRRSSDVRRQRMARSHKDLRSPAHQLSDWPRQTPWILLAGPTHVWWTVWYRRRWDSARFFYGRTMYCTHYYHLYPPCHKATTSDTELTPDCCPNTQHTYPTVTFLHACYIRTHSRFFFHNTRIFNHSLLHTRTDLTFYFHADLHFTVHILFVTTAFCQLS